MDNPLIDVPAGVEIPWPPREGGGSLRFRNMPNADRSNQMEPYCWNEANRRCHVARLETSNLLPHVYVDGFSTFELKNITFGPPPEQPPINIYGMTTPPTIAAPYPGTPFHIITDMDKLFLMPLVTFYFPVQVRISTHVVNRVVHYHLRSQGQERHPAHTAFLVNRDLEQPADVQEALAVATNGNIIKLEPEHVQMIIDWYTQWKPFGATWWLPTAVWDRERGWSGGSEAEVDKRSNGPGMLHVPCADYLNIPLVGLLDAPEGIQVLRGVNFPGHPFIPLHLVYGIIMCYEVCFLWQPDDLLQEMHRQFANDETAQLLAVDAVRAVLGWCQNPGTTLRATNTTFADNDPTQISIWDAVDEGHHPAMEDATIAGSASITEAGSEAVSEQSEIEIKFEPPTDPQDGSDTLIGSDEGDLQIKLEAPDEDADVWGGMHSIPPFVPDIQFDAAQANDELKDIQEHSESDSESESQDGLELEPEPAEGEAEDVLDDTSDGTISMESWTTQLCQEEEQTIIERIAKSDSAEKLKQEAESDGDGSDSEITDDWEDWETEEE